MSRPKGSKNKKTLQDEDFLPIKKEAEPLLINLFGNTKDLKKQIRKLRKLKNTMQPHSKERVELHRKIKEMKEQLAGRVEVDKEKEPLIDEILKQEKIEMFDRVFYNKFSVEQLKKHLIKLQQKKGG